MVIREHRLSEINGKEVVKLDGPTEEGDETQCMIWLTEKAMGIARAQLRLCGFDIDKQNLSVLQDEPFLLAGKTVPIITEDFKGNLRSTIMLNSAPGKKRCHELTTMLRAAKKHDEQAVSAATVAPPNPADYSRPSATAGQTVSAKAETDLDTNRPEFQEDGRDLPF